MNNKRRAGTTVFTANIKNGIWIFGTPSLLFEILNRSIVALSADYLSTVDITQLLIASTVGCF